MNQHLTRREFVAVSAAAAATLAAGRLPAAEFKTRLKKAMIRAPKEKELEALKAAGFDGLEAPWKITVEEAAKARKLAEKSGLKIHSVLRGWTNFNSPKADQVAADITTVEEALRAAQAYGADAVLLVPCRMGGMPMPQPWDFDIQFDEKTGHVQRVAQGDNAPYQKYIEAQNHATDTSREAVKRLIAAAEKTGVVIALENVWNNLWVKPALFAHFVSSFNSPWVKAYFDIGNHAKYAPPEQWIRALGKQIAKCHVKDFVIDRSLPPGGRWVRPRDGDIRWPEVRKALDEVGYNGWLTIEDGGLTLEEYSRRLDLIIAGK